MTRSIQFYARGALFVAAVCWARSAAAEPTPRWELRSADGSVILRDDDICSYDWSTHTFTLVSQESQPLRSRLMKEPRIISGIPFSIAVGGQPIYSGKITSAASSLSFSEPVIVLDASAIDPKIGDHQLQIQLGYPTAEFFKGDDPRANPRIRDALRARGKLTNSPDAHTAWLAASLREMQSIRVGMNRADLLKVFRVEGGLSTRFQRRYVYRDCPFIKVDVRFSAAEAPDDKQKEFATDRIFSISQPFLEWSIND